jgi:hypothetical protein
MSLTNELTTRRALARKLIPPDQLSVMDRATQDLQWSGITASCVKEVIPLH